MNKKNQFGIKLLLSLLILLYIFSKINLSNFLEALVNIKWELFIPAFFLCFVSLISVTLRWKMFLKEQNINVSFKKLYILNMLGNFYGLILPGRISGDIVKGYKLIISDVGERKKELALSVFTDRLVGIISFIFLGLIVILLNPNIRQSLHLNSFFLVAVLFILIFGALLFYSKFTEFFLKKLKLILPAIFFNIVIIKDTYKIFSIYQNKKWVVINGLLFSAAGQLGNIFVYYLICISLGINISFWSLVLVIVITNLIILIPISVSGLGVKEGVLIVLMGYFTISAEKAVAFSLLSSGGLLVMFGVMGVIIELFFMEKIKVMN